MLGLLALKDVLGCLHATCVYLEDSAPPPKRVYETHRPSVWSPKVFSMTPKVW